MIAARSGRDILGAYDYQRTIMALDWNRILIEARGLHLAHSNSSTHGNGEDVCGTCGTCLRNVLLAKEDQWTL